MVIAVIQLLSRIWPLVTPWTAALPGFLPVLHCLPSLLKFTSTESVVPSNHRTPCRPFLLTSIFPSIRIFSSVTALCIRWPKHSSFNFSRYSFTNSLLPEFSLYFNNYNDSSICGVLVCWAQGEVLYMHYFTWSSNVVDSRIIPISQLRKLEH